MTDKTYLWLNADVSNFLLVNRLLKLVMKFIFQNCQVRFASKTSCHWFLKLSLCFLLLILHLLLCRLPVFSHVLNRLVIANWSCSFLPVKTIYFFIHVHGLVYLSVNTCLFLLKNFISVHFVHFNGETVVSHLWFEKHQLRLVPSIICCFEIPLGQTLFLILVFKFLHLIAYLSQLNCTVIDALCFFNV